MRVIALLFACLLSTTASAQTLDRVQGLALQLDALTHRPAMAADGGAPPRPAIGIVGPASDGPAHPAAVTAGWNTFTMTACMAIVAGSQQYDVAYLSNGSAFVTQSSYAVPIIAANCASGGSFLIYFESNLTTISAIASLR